ncbi:MAG TPA: trigger factor, partial [Verrucomicrobiota bacterium]|nr:trigger factor [Verrucomicrobiota bacterium]
MNVTVEQLGPCKVLLRVEIEAPQVDAAFEQAAGEYQRQARLTGFRPGRAPLHLVTRAYGGQIERDVKRKLVGDHYRQAVSEQKLRPFGDPEIEEVQFGRGQAFQFTATLETEPAFPLPDYKGLPVEVEARVVTDDDVERALAMLREQRASFSDVPRAAKAGDVVVVSYHGACEGRPITDHAPTARGLTEQKNFWMKIEPGHFIPGFTEQLAGAAAGERRTVTVTFPADFVVGAVAGKEGVYEVEIVAVKEKHLPELDDEFARQFKVA